MESSIVLKCFHKFHKSIFLDHLDYLVHTKRLSEILNIIPMKYFGDEAARMIANSQTDMENGCNGNQFHTIMYFIRKF